MAADHKPDVARRFICLPRTIWLLIPRAFRPGTAAESCTKVLIGADCPPPDDLGKGLTMTTQAGLEKKEREFLTQCVGDAFTMLDLLPGVDPNGPALVWLADQFVILRRGDCPPAHAMTL